MKKIFIFLLFFLFFANPCFALEITKFKDIYSKLIGAGGAIALLVIVYAGIRFLLSIGKPGEIQTAKNILRDGIIGLIIIAAAGTIYEKVIGEKISFQTIEDIKIETPPPEPEGPGVSFYSEEGCPNDKKSGSFPLKSVKIVNSEDLEFRVVLKTKDNQCQEIFKEGCSKIKFPEEFQALIYFFNPEARGRIIFFEKPYFFGKNYEICQKSVWKVGCDLPMEDEIIDKKLPGDFKDLSFLPTSFEIIGQYIVVLHASAGKCEIFQSEFSEEKKRAGGKYQNLKLIFLKEKIEKVSIFPYK